MKAKIEFKFEDNALKFTLKPKIFNENLKQEALLLDFVRDFSLREQNGVLWIKICVQKTYFSHCLEKMVSL
ncbi:TPA: hypothetical protein R1X65_001318 [Campylobacter upsaliensis]|nr:hypothetical protein [Campylobacter upsaliensis]HEC1567019.1 hypothetical protein [Campylobacter upsaliensis]HEF3569831.1 hypothetical protein [Campylobacter upsaliensis]HEF3575118.1 hypothetical protein [Campylobacter upsaliensis]